MLELIRVLNCCVSSVLKVISDCGDTSTSGYFCLKSWIFCPIPSLCFWL